MVYHLYVSVIMAVYGVIHYYIGQWFWNRLGDLVPFLNAAIYWIVLAILVAISLVGVIWNRHLPSLLRDSVYLFASYWLVALLYFIISIAAIDLVRFMDKWLGFIPATVKSAPAAPIAVGLLVILAVVALLAYGTLNTRSFKRTSYQISVAKSAGTLKQLRIALLSDIHLSGMEDKGLVRLVEAVNRMEPDLVLIPGDLIDANRDAAPYEQDAMENNFRKIKSKFGVYASFGNHDYDERGDSADRAERFNRAGVHVLRDSRVLIGDSFYLIGREDISYERISGRKRKSLSSLMEGADPKLPVIVLDHQPVHLEEPKQAGVDLQVSGHTHNGQLFPLNLITRRLFEIDYGHLQSGDFHIVVTSGARTWGAPVRIGTHSELVDLTVHFQKP